MRLTALYHLIGIGLLGLCLSPVFNPPIVAMEYATFKGSVKTQSGEVVPEVTLVLHHETRGDKSIKVDKDGTFKARLFELGKYTITVQSPGYIVYALKHEDKSPVGLPQSAENLAIGEDQVIPELSVSSEHTYEYDFILAPNTFFQVKAQQEEMGRLQNDVLQAEEKINAGLHADAIPILQKVIEKKPDLGYPHYLLGVSYFETGKRDDARTCFRNSLEKKPDLTGANYYLGKLAYDAGDKETAITCFEAELAISPNQSAAVESLAVLYRDLGNKEKSADYFERLRKIRPEDEKILSELLVLYTDMGKDDKVKEIVAAQEQMGQQDASTYYNLGSTYWSEKQYESAESAFRKALEKDPMMAAAYKGLGYALIQLKKNKDALEALQKYIQLKPDAEDKSKIQEIINELKQQSE